MIIQFLIGVITASLLILAGSRVRQVQKSWLGIVLILSGASSIFMELVHAIWLGNADYIEISEEQQMMVWSVISSCEYATSIVSCIAILVFAIRLPRNPLIPGE